MLNSLREGFWFFFFLNGKFLNLFVYCKNNSVERERWMIESGFQKVGSTQKVRAFVSGSGEGEGRMRTGSLGRPIGPAYWETHWRIVGSGSCPFEAGRCDPVCLVSAFLLQPQGRWVVGLLQAWGLPGKNKGRGGRQTRACSLPRRI